MGKVGYSIICQTFIAMYKHFLPSFLRLPFEGAVTTNHDINALLGAATGHCHHPHQDATAVVKLRSQIKDDAWLKKVKTNQTFADAMLGTTNDIHTRAGMAWYLLHVSSYLQANLRHLGATGRIAVYICMYICMYVYIYYIYINALLPCKSNSCMKKCSKLSSPAAISSASAQIQQPSLQISSGRRH